MGDTTVDVYGYSEIQCIRLKARCNEIQSLLYSLNLTMDTMRYNVSGPSLDTMDTYLPSRIKSRLFTLDLSTGKSRNFAEKKGFLK